MTSRRHLAVARLGLVTALSLYPARALADTGDSAAAQALFDDAKRLMNAGQYASACPKFAESQRLDPGIGTMLWLADCHEKSGKVASAWALFNEAEALASRTKDPRAGVAREQARKLEAKLSMLVIVVKGASDVHALEIKRDGVVLGRASWGSPIPTDPGAHHVVASAPGRLVWETTVTLSRDGGSTTVEIPPLAMAPAPVASTVVAPTDEPRPDPTRGRTQRVIGLGLVGVGVAGAVVGGYFGLQAGSKNDESRAHCLGNSCDDTGYDQRRDALSAATVSNVAFVAAALALVGGAVLYLTSPSPTTRTTASASLLPSSGAAALFRGAFE